MKVDLSEDNLSSTMGEYEPLLCDACKQRLKSAGEPLRERLNAGKPPSIRHVKKLLRALCPVCTVKIANKNNRGG